MKIAAVGDLHCELNSRGAIRKLIEPAGKEADILVLAGDLTAGGLIKEMEVLLDDLNGFDLPVVAVMGNHDHESDQQPLLARMMSSRGICVLDNATCTILDIGFIGTKGFCGGFHKYRIQPFGERAIKNFVRESVDEVLKMEAALETLEGRYKVGVVHYSPIRETLHGESLELYPFLGSSLIADAFDRHRVDVIFHGHAHNGSLHGHTRKGIPVFNVSLPVVMSHNRGTYMVYELT